MAVELDNFKNSIVLEADSRRAALESKEPRPKSIGRTFGLGNVICPREASMQQPALPITQFLAFRRKIYHIPFLGYLIKLIVSISRLPIRLEQLYKAQEHLLTIESKQAETVKLVTALQQSQTQLREFCFFLESEIQVLKGLNHETRTESEKLRREFGRIIQGLQERVTGLTRSLVETPPRGTDQPKDRANPPPIIQPSMIPDSFYQALENRFRSSPESLKQHFAEYDSFLPESTETKLAIDLGCGRGDWLDYLNEKGFDVLGVDTNHVALEETKQKGIAVRNEDGLIFLGEAADKSADVLSCFHLVEHMEPGQILTLIERAYRVLRPNGILIIETPNPENITVSSCNFYTDPTHKRPIPPPLLGFMLESVGFQQLDCIRFNPACEEYAGRDPFIRFASRWFSIGQDYAIIAQKPEYN
jgi:2-polyprenyl-3-methyl-5-hydroxy-6-metoxy-1,4-benzoquinol methylase